MLIGWLRASFVTLDRALKILSSRVNAENVTIQRSKRCLHTLSRELDELERGDFTRLKLVKKKRRKSETDTNDKSKGSSSSFG
jgi:V-type H+-transporting ATPase subunit D